MENMLKEDRKKGGWEDGRHKKGSRDIGVVAGRWDIRGKLFKRRQYVHAHLCVPGSHSKLVH